MTDFKKIILAALEDQGGVVSQRQSKFNLPTSSSYQVFWPKLDELFLVEFSRGNEVCFYGYIARKGFCQINVYSKDLLDPHWSPSTLAQRFSDSVNN